MDFDLLLYDIFARQVRREHGIVKVFDCQDDELLYVQQSTVPPDK